MTATVFDELNVNPVSHFEVNGDSLTGYVSRGQLWERIAEGKSMHNLFTVNNELKSADQEGLATLSSNTLLVMRARIGSMIEWHYTHEEIQEYIQGCIEAKGTMA